MSSVRSRSPAPAFGFDIAGGPYKGLAVCPRPPAVSSDERFALVALIRGRFAPCRRQRDAPPMVSHLWVRMREPRRLICIVSALAVTVAMDSALGDPLKD